MNDCHLCGGQLTTRHRVREMMQGTRQEFVYGECGQCGSLQLIDVPDDLGKHYPRDYYSFVASRPSILRQLAKRLRAELLVAGHRELALRIGRSAEPPAWVEWLDVTGLDRSATILDIGCGNGDLLAELKVQGFRSLSGADAFIERSTTRNGIPIRKATPTQLDGQHQLVMLNHSFEHMPDPVGTLRTLTGRLASGGWLLIRVPVAASPLWDEFGTHWCSIDAPRHLYLPSHAGMRAAIQRAGLELVRTLHETSVIQFWRSAQFQQDISLFDPRAYEVNPRASGITEEQVGRWRERAAEMNRTGNSAAAAFFVRRP